MIFMALSSRKKADSYRYGAIILGILGFMLIIVGFYVHILLIVVSMFFFAIASYVWKKQTTWAIGAKGEESVIRVLRKLDPSFKRIHDVFLPGTEGNIDHVVVGPTGVFVIETKNHNGTISCNGDYWGRKKVGRRGTVYSSNIGNPSKQAKRNSLMLKKWLESKNINVGYITAVVVFTNNDLQLKVTRPTVKVVQTNNLLGVLEGESNYKMTQEKINSITSKLQQLK
jgi:hypothetical protein